MNENELVSPINISHTNLCRYDACNDEYINVEHDVNTYLIDSACILHTSITDSSAEVEHIVQDIHLLDQPEFCSMNSVFDSLPNSVFQHCSGL